MFSQQKLEIQISPSFKFWLNNWGMYLWQKSITLPSNLWSYSMNIWIENTFLAFHLNIWTLQTDLSGNKKKKSWSTEIQNVNMVGMPWQPILISAWVYKQSKVPFLTTLSCIGSAVFQRKYFTFIARSNIQWFHDGIFSWILVCFTPLSFW
jgi:hypothetical protein